ncbi:glycoside hydrolase family 97 N-terminal domain-containing protein [Glycomyces sp. A-F 0318]|uniref:glycoside hydrolase family 97 N-terminal domain-containing protein n=1 Tax=Glycomyces amatae TaxID=2881355 RepID=UPI001E4E9DE3|nr:glycoside hydrolase family 97 N-terminal domain-containing protein [Glycomyces amatae]MCD0446809.1 glycoside hydrolase family 97 N-terminal domain-containing protein [Glycomyces amatae]
MSSMRGRRRPIGAFTAAVVTAAAAATVVAGGPAHAAAAHSVSSPDGSITFTVTDQPDGSLTYEVTAGSTTIFEESPLGIATDGVDFRSGLAFAGEERSSIDETYTLPAGTDPSYRDHAEELVLEYTKDGEAVELVVRAYDDGVAYRYRLPGDGDLTITDEASGFRLPAGTGGWAADWNGNYEQDYVYRGAAQLNSGADLTMPLLASISDNEYFTLITEANVYNANAGYAPAMLEGDGQGTGLLKVARTPDQAFPIASAYPFQTPWRTAVVAADLDALYNTDLVQNLNPAAQEQPDWVAPGRAGWTWYTDDDSAADMDKQKQMVDFAASMGWEYVTVDCCYDPAADLPEISEYAAQRGVEIFAWVTAEPFATPELAGPLAAEHKAYGVAGLKVDFFLNDSQEVQEWYQSIGDAAGENELMLDLHGSTKPSGENRTWPWVLTTEAVAGTEHYKYPPPTTARLDATLPFTRGPLGSMDYTPAMISQNDSILTQAHTLAQSIVFTSAMVNYADSAAAYGQWPGRHLLRAVPTVWDESHVVEGFPGDHVTVARRSGEDWFIGALTDGARTATVPLDFLDSPSDDGGTYTATVFADDANGRVEVSTQEVTSGDTLSLPMIATGGVSVHLSRTPLEQIGADDTRYEAEDQVLGGSAAVGACKGCSEGAKVGYLGAGGSVEFADVTATEAGTHEMTFTYTSGDPRDVRITVNGEVLSTEALTDSGGWEFVNQWTVDVPLEAGSNTIRFDNPDQYAPDIDAITVSATAEAEDPGNTLNGGAAVATCDECSGGSLVTGLDGTGSLTVADLGTAAAGNHTVRLHYASAVDATVLVGVGGGAPVEVALPATGSDTAVATKTIGLDLPASGGAVTVSGASAPGVGVDGLTVVR